MVVHKLQCGMMASRVSDSDGSNRRPPVCIAPTAFRLTATHLSVRPRLRCLVGPLPEEDLGAPVSETTKVFVNLLKALSKRCNWRNTYTMDLVEGEIEGKSTRGDVRAEVEVWSEEGCGVQAVTTHGEGIVFNFVPAFNRYNDQTHTHVFARTHTLTLPILHDH